MRGAPCGPRKVASLPPHPRGPRHEGGGVSHPSEDRGFARGGQKALGLERKLEVLTPSVLPQASRARRSGCPRSRRWERGGPASLCSFTPLPAGSLLLLLPTLREQHAGARSSRGGQKVQTRGSFRKPAGSVPAACRRAGSKKQRAGGGRGGRGRTQTA